MHCKTRNWMKKIRQIGLRRRRFGGWMSGSEFIVRRNEEQKLRTVEQQNNNIYPMQTRKAAPAIEAYPLLSSSAHNELDLWELRKQLVIQIAKRRNGKVRLREVAVECNVSIRIAAVLLKRLALEGMLSLVVGQQNTIVYSLQDVGPG